MNNKMELKTLIITVIIAVIFVYLWRKGYLLRLNTFVQETREELRKCTWPSTAELKGSTAVVLFVTAALGLYIVGVDFLLVLFINFVTAAG
ncbi:MAG TPA: preprotein translocase subunit SecE [Verrucomicrobiota bacterium]|nr:preprotein translocase subunit SecE [Verrucomicrobiota bacterium]